MCPLENDDGGELGNGDQEANVGIFPKGGGSAKCYAMVLWCPIIQGSDQCAQIVIDIFVFGNKSCLF